MNKVDKEKLRHTAHRGLRICMHEGYLVFTWEVKHMLKNNNNNKAGC